MSTPILATKLYIPPPRPNLVHRPRLIEQLNAGLHRKLTLISAPAGFGKTTLVSAWMAGCKQLAAWLSLDEGDSDPMRFLAYLVAALQTVAPNVGEAVLVLLNSPQPPPTEAILTTLLNEIATIPDNFVLVLDDYHVLDAGGPLGAIDEALTFLLDHLPLAIDLCPLGLAWVLFPALFHTPMETIALFAPDVFSVIVMLTALSLGWAMARLFFTLQPRRFMNKVMSNQ